MASLPAARLTVEQYLAIERNAEFRSEYIDGEMYAMAGGSINHALIATAVSATLTGQQRGKPCAAAGSDLRLYCRAGSMLTYADVVVFCGPRKLLDGEKDTLTDATLIVEVLSPSTKNYDRGEKFRLYRGLESFEEYLLLEQDRIQAEHYVRQQDRSWIFREFSGPDVTIELKSIGCRLNLGTVYERVEF
jgi:Uma2 family endonuclease